MQQLMIVIDLNLFRFNEKNHPLSVAPSFFQSCVSDGKTARMEDVLRYKVSVLNYKF